LPKLDAPRADFAHATAETVACHETVVALATILRLAVPPVRRKSPSHNLSYHSVRRCACKTGTGSRLINRLRLHKDTFFSES
jgi:hypothetical protein